VLTGRRWLTVLLPVVLFSTLEIVGDSYLDQFLPAPVVLLVGSTCIFGVSFVFARLAFQRIDGLSATVHRRNAELERRNASLEGLRRMGLAMTTLSSLQEVLQTVADNARRLLGADIAVIALAGADGVERLAAASSSDEALLQLATRMNGLGDTGSGPLRSRLAAPLLRGDVTLGTLCVGARTHEPSYGPDEFDVLSSLASQASVALENDRLQRELRELAIRGERERIAREMHDGLAQVLGYVSTKAQAIEELLAVQQTDRARQHLVELSTAARSVYVDVREAILGLSSPIAPERGLVGALEEYTSRFAAASNLATRVSASPSAHLLRLAPEVQAQVFRIVQETLTNVRKHASAQHAVIALDVEGHELHLTVTDDGQGFDVSAPLGYDWPRYGMQSIRERAASIGAEVAWSSQLGEGTLFHLTIPLVSSNGDG
jgi:signal transduction histidine kinase